MGKLFKNFLSNLWVFFSIDALPDAVIFVNNAGIVQRYNSKAINLFGIVERETDILFNEIVKDGMALVHSSAKNSRPYTTTFGVGDTEVYVELNASETAGGYVVSLRDTTQMTKQLDTADLTRKFNYEKNAMLSLLTDDIKSPLTSISGFSKGLLDGIGGPLTDKQSKYVKIINDNSDSLYNFLDKFLQFSNAESSIYKSDFHSFDIADAIKNISENYKNIITQKNLEFVIDDKSLEKRNVYTDYNSIKDAYSNIFEVALKMTETGYISVKIAHPDDFLCSKFNLNPDYKTSYALIDIVNTASFSEDEMRFLCEPYAQLEKNKKNLVRAFQLGSASIMVKRVNGYINIISDQNTSKFTIIIPIEKK